MPCAVGVYGHATPEARPGMAPAMAAAAIVASAVLVASRGSEQATTV
jgi:hypothetical protein